MKIELHKVVVVVIVDDDDAEYDYRPTTISKAP